MHTSGRPLVFSWGALLAGLWLYRSVFSVLGETFVIRLTGIADTETYQTRDLFSSVSALGDIEFGLALQMQSLATLFTKIVGAAFGFLFAGDRILINVGYQSIAFIGLLAVLRSVDGGARLALFALFTAPSFTLWSSIATKEALIVFMLGIMMAYIIRLYRNTARLRWYHPVVLLGIYIFKPHYLIPIVFLLAVTTIGNRVREHATAALVALLASMGVLFLYAPEIDQFSRSVNLWMIELGGRSTREIMLIEPNDTFWKAPTGMLLAFTGPSLEEALRGHLLHVLSFVESSLLLCVFCFLLIRRLPRIPVYNFLVFLGTVFWVMFPNYPPGISNPGTAIRYRTGYIMIIFIAFVFLLSRQMYVGWRAPRQQPVGASAGHAAFEASGK